MTRRPRERSKATLRILLAAFAATGIACSGPGPMDGSVDADAAGEVPDVGPRPMPQTPALCATAEEAPLRDDTGATHCTRVGVSVLAETPPQWPNVTSAPAPVYFVDPAAAPGGDGSMALPFREIATALAATPAARTIVLSRGEHRVASQLELTRSVGFIGVGAKTRPEDPTAGTVIRSVRGRGVFTAATTGIEVSMTGLAIQYDELTVNRADIAVSVTGGGTLTLRNVGIYGAATGIYIRGSRLDGALVSVRNAGVTGIALESNSAALLVHTLVADGQQGIFAGDSHLLISRSMLHNNQFHGIAMLGAADSSGGTMTCPVADLGAPRGPRDCIDRVVMLNNGVTGMYVGGMRTVEVRRSTFSGTQVTPPAFGGDGLYATTGATLTLDSDIVTEAAQGTGSAFVANTRVGILVQGAGTSVSVNGANIASNAGPGVFVANFAALTGVKYSAISDNTGAGIGVSSGGTIVAIQCNGLLGTRMGTIVTEEGRWTIGDGISISQFEGRLPIAIDGNQISHNEQFALRAVRANARLDGNLGAENRWAIGSLASSLEILPNNRVFGREATPAGDPEVVNGAFQR